MIMLLVGFVLSAVLYGFFLWLAAKVTKVDTTFTAMMIAAAGASARPEPISTISSRDDTINAAIVTPEIGLFDEPTTPAM